jgi:hypothetical protein
MHTLRRRLALCALSLVVSSCGGGGGGGGNSDGPPSEPSAGGAESPLTIAPANGKDVASFTVAISEAALVVGQFAFDEASAWRGVVGSISCSNGGTKSTTLQDRDGSGTLSSGDVLTVTFVNCWHPLLASVLDGSAEITIEPSVRADGRAGRLSFAASSLKLGDGSGQQQAHLGGSLRFDGHAVRMSSSMAVRADGAADLTFTLFDGGVSVVERVRRFSFAKVLSLVSARYELTLAGQLASTVLNGRVEIGTDAALAGWMGAVPENGRVSVQGANSSKVRLAARNNAGEFVTDVVVAESGVDTSAGTFDWIEAASGYFFWAQGAVPLRSGGDPFPVPTTRAPAFERLSATPAFSERLPLNARIEWQMSMPVDASALGQLALRREPPESSPGVAVPDADWGDTHVPLQVTVEGTRMTLAATSQLQPGRTYVLASRPNSSSTYSVEATLSDTLGRPLVLQEFRFTRSGMRAAISMPYVTPQNPSNALFVDASGSVDDASPLTTYAWRQVGGPAVVIDSPNAVSTGLTFVGGWPTRAATVEMEVTVANAAGEVDVARSSLPVTAIPSTSPLYYARLGASGLLRNESLVVLDGAARWEASLPAPYLFQVFVFDPAGPVWNFTFSTLYGTQTLVPGLFSGDDNPFAPVSVGLGINRWVVDLRQITWDAQGKITLLDLDYYFETSSGNSYGAIRIASATPVRP